MQRIFLLIFLKKNPYNFIMSLTTSIPNWNANGILPPIAPGASSTSRDRSPYNVNLSEFVNHFSYSDERIEILDGFLRFREDLQIKGFVVGFQWLNGSFIENIEETEGRPPHDLDVVTFYSLPDSENQSSRFAPNFLLHVI